MSDRYEAYKKWLKRQNRKPTFRYDIAYKAFKAGFSAAKKAAKAQP